MNNNNKKIFKISYLQHYQTSYNIKIFNANQPLLIHKQKRRSNQIIHLIPELCFMTGL